MSLHTKLTEFYWRLIVLKDLTETNVDHLYVDYLLKPLVKIKISEQFLSLLLQYTNIICMILGREVERPVDIA